VARDIEALAKIGVGVEAFGIEITDALDFL
jgi:hypothetical protein